MTYDRFNELAGEPRNSCPRQTYKATMLSQILIEHMDERGLLELVDKAIAAHGARLEEIRLTRNAWITPDRKRQGDPVEPELSDEMFGRFDETAFLRGVRDRILASAEEKEKG